MEAGLPVEEHDVAILQMALHHVTVLELGRHAPSVAELQKPALPRAIFPQSGFITL